MHCRKSIVTKSQKISSLKLGPSPFFSIRFGAAKKYDVFCVVRAVEATEVIAVKHDKGLCFSGNKWYIG